MIVENSPDIWQRLDLTPETDGHKYDRGHVAVFGGEDLTGAACMAADAAMRSGCGLCTIFADGCSVDIYKSFKPYIMANNCPDICSFSNFFDDKRIKAVLIGCGAGHVDDGKLQSSVIDLLKMKKNTVLDADVFKAFAGDSELLAKYSHDNVVYTPHEGEFDCLFPKMSGDRIEKARKASEILGGVLVLKGASTIIASKKMGVVVQKESSPWLASAGSGDVLAGIIVGLMVQKIPAFEAACMGVWIHSNAGILIGQGLVATDIIDKIPEILKKM